VLDEVLQLCRETKEDTTNMRGTLDAVVQDVAAVKMQVDSIDTRVKKVEQDNVTLTNRVVSLEKKKRETEEEMEKRIEKRILEKLRAEQVPVRQEQRAPPSPLQTKTNPAMGGKTGKKIHEAFQELLRAAEARKNTFLFGVIEQYTPTGAQLRPLLSYDRIVRRFFHGIRYEMKPLGRAQSTDMPLGKVVVHLEDVHEAKLRIRDRWRETRDYGWWVGQENPPDLRFMQANAFRFIMYAKKVCEELRRFYLEAEEGFIRFARVPFLPVYLVPTKEAKWKDLSHVLLKMVLSVRGRDWMDRFRGVKELEPELIIEWNRILKRDEFEGDSSEENSAEEDGLDEELLLASKLRQPGRFQGRGPPYGASGGYVHRSQIFTAQSPALTASSPVPAPVINSTQASSAHPGSPSAELRVSSLDAKPNGDDSFGSAPDDEEQDKGEENGGETNGDVEMN
jgi:hypothetical protein